MMGLYATDQIVYSGIATACDNSGSTVTIKSLSRPYDLFLPISSRNPIAPTNQSAVTLVESVTNSQVRMATAYLCPPVDYGPWTPRQVLPQSRVEPAWGIALENFAELVRLGALQGRLDEESLSCPVISKSNVFLCPM